MPLTTRAKSGPNLLSLSRIRNLGACPKGVASGELSGEPGIGGMAGHSNMEDFSALQVNDEEGKERTKEEVGDRQEVAGPNLMGMVVQEGGPRLRSRACAFRA